MNWFDWILVAIIILLLWEIFCIDKCKIYKYFSKVSGNIHKYCENKILELERNKED